MITETTKFFKKFIHVRNFNSTLYIVTVIIALIGCTKNQAQEPIPDPSNATVTVENVSYANFGKAFFEAKCSSCHASGRSASARWNFNGYNSVQANIKNINNAVLVSKSMPIGSSLTAKEIELLSAWIKRNTPEN